jgi:large subunit ribosomal protein L35
MPKLKTNKGTKKRVRLTGKGKIKHFKSGKGHLLTGKTNKRKRKMRRPGYVSDGDRRMILNLIPYGA